MHVLFTLFFLALLWGGCARSETVTVFAAASLRNAIDEIAQAWRQETGNKIAVSYAGSGLLARQIFAGAQADIFISANSLWMNELENRGMISDGYHRDLLTNRLALIAYDHRIKPVEIGFDSGLTALIGKKRLATALVDSAPAGQYAKAALLKLGLWKILLPQIVQTDNVRVALRLVSRGDVSYGIVYQSDVVADGTVATLALFPEGYHPKIIYPIALLKKNTKSAGVSFYKALSSEQAYEIFEKWGFIPLR